MADQISIEDQITGIMVLMRQKLGVRGGDLRTALARARYRLPRRVYRQGMELVQAEPLAAHPKLSLTLDSESLAKAEAGVRKHLDSIDLADRRKGWFLGVLGGLAFSLMLLLALLITVLVWRGLL